MFTVLRPSIISVVIVSYMSSRKTIGMKGGAQVLESVMDIVGYCQADGALKPSSVQGWCGLALTRRTTGIGVAASRSILPRPTSDLLKWAFH